MDWQQRLKLLVDDDIKRGRMTVKLLRETTEFRTSLFNDNDDAVRAALDIIDTPVADGPAGTPLTVEVMKEVMNVGAPLTVEVMKGLDDVVNKIDDTVNKMRMPLTAMECLSMSSVSTNVAIQVLAVAGLRLYDGSADDPAEDVVTGEQWKFNMGLYPLEEQCYDPLFKHIVEYLKIVHHVNIQREGPFTRGQGVCRLLDVHKQSELMQSELMELELELSGRLVRISGKLDAVFVPPRIGRMQYTDWVIGGIEVKHTSAQKESFKQGASTSGIAKSGSSCVPGQALVEALAMYAHSSFSKAIFLLTSFDDNVVLELRDKEVLCWDSLNFAQAMDKIAKFLNSDDVLRFLGEVEKPVRQQEPLQLSEDKRSVRQKLKIGGVNEEFLEQVEVIRSAAENDLDMVSDLFALMETWRYSMNGASGSGGPLSYFS